MSSRTVCEVLGLLSRSPGELYQRAATAATMAMKGRLANKYYQLAEEAAQEQA